MIQTVEEAAMEGLSSPILRTKMTTTTTTTTTTTAAAPASQEKLSTELWFIHGKYYDLSEFAAKHPGGKTILKMTMGLEDATPCMESYHAMANRDYIKRTMQQYQVTYVPADAAVRSRTQIKYLFEQDGFYMELSRRIRKHFGANSDGESVTAKVKINAWWKFKVAVLSFVYLVSFALAFFLPNLAGGLGEEYKYAMAALAGSSLIMVGFNVMHDASHFALGVRDSWINRTALRAWNSLALWDSGKWLFHHTVRHHSFTGDSKLDPDVVHARPIVRKHVEESTDNYLIHFAPLEYRATTVYTVISTFFYALMLNYGQLLAYNVIWPLQGILWELPLAKTQNQFDKFWWEYALSALVVGAHVYRADWGVSLAYFTAASFSYGMCILADHDTFESAVENHVDEGEMDWGEVQTRHASDFASKGMYGRVFSELFGSINAQIAHHLFPSVNHVHLFALVPIIRQCCEEYKIPYANHDSLTGALFSVSKTLKSINQDAIDKTVGNSNGKHE
ncbi:hypothetical protein BASA81_012927 [Batrachochytrium salamandrivorans]|nr:hypothetical protein BASA81_012927 [Batrachochytrium salamandrivorans]